MAVSCCCRLVKALGRGNSGGKTWRCSKQPALLHTEVHRCLSVLSLDSMLQEALSIFLNYDFCLQPLESYGDIAFSQRLMGHPNFDARSNDSQKNLTHMILVFSLKAHV